MSGIQMNQEIRYVAGAGCPIYSLIIRRVPHPFARSWFLVFSFERKGGIE